MSTRGCYRFTDERDCFTVYKHSDNSPYTKDGGIAAIRKATAHAWPLPRFEADEFAASFVAANKEAGGGVRLLNTPNKQTLAHMPADIKYLYDVSVRKGGLWIVVSEIVGSAFSDNRTAKPIAEGSLEWPDR